MTSFGTPGPLSRVRRDRAEGIPRQGIVESLTAPGLQALPPVADSTVAQLFSSLGLVGQAVEDSARFSARQNELAAEAERGLARRHAAELLPQLQADIESGKYTPASSDAVPELAREIIARESGSASPAYAEAFADHLTGPLNRLLQVRSATVIGEAREAHLADLSRALDGPDAKPSDIIAHARSVAPGLTEEEIIAKTVIPAATRAAELGQTDRLESLTSGLPASFDTEKTRLMLQASAASDRNARLVENDAKQVIFGELNKVAKGESGFAAVRSTIERFRSSKAIDEQTAFSLSETVNNQEAEQLRSAYNGLKDQIVKGYLDNAVTTLAPLLDRGDVTGGAPALIRDIPIEFPDRTKRVIKADEIADAVRDQKWSQIDREFPPTERPQQNLAAKIDWLGRNPGIIDPTLKAGFSGARFRVQADSTDQTVQPSLVAAYQTYKAGSSMNNRVIAAHMGRDDEDYFRVAQFLEENFPDTTPGNALIMAARSMQSVPGVAATVTRMLDYKPLRKAVASLGEAKNNNAAQAAIESRARAYIVISGKDDEAAIKQAAADFAKDYTLLNGYWVRTRGKPVLSSVNLPSAARAIVGAYAKQHGEDPDDFTIIPNEQTGGWSVSVSDTGLPAPGSPVYTDSDLSEIDAEIKGNATRAATKEAIKKSEEYQKGRATQAYSSLKQIAGSMRAHAATYGTFDPIPLPSTEGLDFSGHPAEPAPTEPPSQIKPVIDFIRTKPPEKPKREPRPLFVPNPRIPAP